MPRGRFLKCLALWSSAAAFLGGCFQGDGVMMLSRQADAQNSNQEIDPNSRHEAPVHAQPGDKHKAAEQRSGHGAEGVDSVQPSRTDANMPEVHHVIPA